MSFTVHAGRAVALLGASVLLNGCTSLTDTGTPDPYRYGAVNITASGASATSARADATVIFFEAITVAVPNSSLQQSDNCVFSAVDTLPVVTQGQSRAGETVSLTASGTTLELAYSETLKRYATVAGQPFAYNTGDVAQISIPGNATVFPAQSISVKLAEPILPQPIAMPEAGMPLQVRWNALNDNTAAIALSLRYADPTSSPYANRQIYCEVKDDGAFDIPAAGITSFLISPAHLRTMTLTRWRTNELMPDNRTVLHIVTSIDSTIAIP